MVVHSLDGLDEISIASETFVTELKNGQISEYTIKPEDFGVDSQSLIGLDVANASASLELIRDALGDKTGKYAQKAATMIALNAGSAIYVAGITDSLKQGISTAQDIINSGRALEKIDDLARFTQALADQ